MACSHWRGNFLSRSPHCLLNSVWFRCCITLEPLNGKTSIQSCDVELSQSYRRVLNCGNWSKGTKTFAWVTFMSIFGVPTQNIPPRSSWTSPGYGTRTNRQKNSCSTFWSSFRVLEVKDDLYRACKKERNKLQRNCVIAPDALPGSAQLDHLHNCCVLQIGSPLLNKWHDCREQLLFQVHWGIVIYSAISGPNESVRCMGKASYETEGLEGNKKWGEGSGDMTPPPPKNLRFRFTETHSQPLLDTWV